MSRNVQQQMNNKRKEPTVVCACIYQVLQQKLDATATNDSINCW